MFFFPIYIPRAVNTGTCLWQGDLFYSAGIHRNHVLATANAEKLGEVLEKNAGGWTERVEISKEEISGSKRSIYGYILTYCSKRIESTIIDANEAQAGSAQQSCRRAVTITCALVTLSIHFTNAHYSCVF